MVVRKLPKTKDVDMKRLRDDIKKDHGTFKSLVQDGLTIKHLELKDKALLSAYVFVCGYDRLIPYMIDNSKQFKNFSEFSDYLGLVLKGELVTLLKKPGSKKSEDCDEVSKIAGMEMDCGFALCQNFKLAKEICERLGLHLVSRNHGDDETNCTLYMSGYHPVNNEGYLFAKNKRDACFEEIW